MAHTLALLIAAMGRLDATGDSHVLAPVRRIGFVAPQRALALKEAFHKHPVDDGQTVSVRVMGFTKCVRNSFRFDARHGAKMYGDSQSLNCVSQG